MAKVLKRILRLVIYALGGIIVVLALVALFTQTALFRDRLRSGALAALDSALIADIRMGELSGNLVTGFSIDSVSVRARGQDLLTVDRVTLRYNLLALFSSNISVHSILFEHPVMALRRDRSGLWNLAAIVRPTQADTLPSRPFSWSVDVRRLEMRDGEVLLIDSTGLEDTGSVPGNRPHLHYDQIQVRDLDLALSAHKSSDEYRVVLSSLSCSVASPEFRLNHLSGDFSITPATARVSDFRLITDSTYMLLDASLDSVDVMGGLSLGRMRKAPVAMELQLDKFNFGDLAYFLPAVGFLHGNLAGRVVAGGDFDSLSVDELYLKFGGSNLALKGELRNLAAPDSLMLSMRMEQSVIAPEDPLYLMPEFSLPNLRSLGPARIELGFYGHPTDFRSDFRVATEAGVISSDSLRLTIGGTHTLRYKGAVAFREVNLARILDSPAWESRLTGALTVEGRGVDIQRIDALGRAVLDSSEFRRLPLLGSALSLQASNNHVEGTVNLALGDAHIGLEGGMDVRSTSDRAFHLRGALRSFDLQNLLEDSTYNSDLNLRLDLQAHGNSLKTLEGTLDCDISHSRYRAYALDEARIRVSLSQNDTLHKELLVSSPFVDLSLTGAFDLNYMANTVALEVQNLRGALAEKFSMLDSSLFVSVDDKDFARQLQNLSLSTSPLHAEFDVTIKNLDPFPHLFRTRIFDGSGTLKGRLQGDHHSLQGSVSLDVTEFYYGDVQSGVLIEQGTCTFDVDGLKPTRRLGDFDARLDASVGRLDISSTEFQDIHAKVSVHQEQATFSTKATIDHNSRLETVGSSRVDRDTLVFEIERLSAAYRDFAWNAVPGAVVHVTRQGLSLDGMTLLRNGESLRARGALDNDGTLRGRLEGRSLELDDLKYALTEKDLSTVDQIFSGLATFTVDVGGTAESPVMNGSFRADTVSVHSIPFGTLLGGVALHSNILTLDLRAYETAPGERSEPILAIDGSIPLASASVSEAAASQEDMNLSVRSTGVNINLLDPFLPTFDQLSGLLACDLTVRGTPREPFYTGAIQFKGIRFLFAPNNITYFVDGSFEAVGRRIKVTQATIRNIPDDEQSDRIGLVELTGDFAMDGFKPGDFNLLTTGKLLVVKESTRKSSLSVYGNLFVEIGPAGLHFTGEVERSLLKGELFIRNSSLVFPPTQATVTQESPLSVPIVIYDDTSTFREKEILSAAERYFGDRDRKRMDSPLQNLAGSVSFIDGLRYDLDIEAVGGNTEVRMVFNPISGEELVAIIDGKFSITDDGTRWFGDLGVTRAYYYFYRRFDAEGRMRFTGDFINPGLDITARYSGVRAVSDTLRGDRREIVVVTVRITGSRNQPKLAMSMSIDEAEYAMYRGLKSNDEQSDAIGFIIYGSFPLNSAQRDDVPAEVQKTLGSSLLTGASSMLTGTLSEFLRTQTGFINSVELSFNASSSRSTASAADIRLSGVAWSGYWRYGGQVFEDPLGNANFSLQYSLGTVFRDPALRNLMLELERRVEIGTFGQINDLRRTNSARLFYRFSF